MKIKKIKIIICSLLTYSCQSFDFNPDYKKNSQENHLLTRENQEKKENENFKEYIQSLSNQTKDEEYTISKNFLVENNSQKSKDSFQQENWRKKFEKLENLLSKYKKK